MTDTPLTEPAPPRKSRARRRETVINTLAGVLGCLALVVMIATVFRVVTAKLWESTQINPDYVDSLYEDVQGRGWSGDTRENKALITAAGDVKPTDDKPNLKDLTRKDGSKSDDKAGASSTTAAAESTVSATQVPAPVLSNVNGIANIEAKRIEIEAVIRGFFESNSIDMKLVFARDSMRVRPLMENFYRSHPLTPPRWKNLGWLMSVDEKGYRFGYAQAVFDDAEPISVVIEETTEGKYRVDWESSVSYGELDWKEFLKVRPAEPTLLRVIASKPQVTPEGSAEKGYEYIEIKHPAQEGTVLASFDRNDPKFHSLIEQLQSGNWKDVPLTLRLCFPGTSSTGGTSLGAKIANIEGKGWLILQGNRS
jgi:hypothetical protein